MTSAPSPTDTERSGAPTLGLLPIIALSTAVAGAARAQDDGVVLPPIIVQSYGGAYAAQDGYALTDSTSDKVPTPIADTPKSITVVTEKEIEERGATSLYDVLRTTPGITLQAGEGGTPAGDIPYIRGSNASNDIMLDGIRNSSRTSYEAFNLESVEIHKGPGGAESGPGAEGGTISLNSKVPLPGKFDEVQLTYGTGNYRRATLDSNRNFGNFGARLNLMYQDADDLGGKTGKTSKRFGIAPSFSYNLGDASKVTLGYYYYRNEDMPDYGVRMSNEDVPDAYRVGSGTPDDPWQPIDVPTDTFYGTPGRDFTDNTSKSGYLRFDHAFSDQLKFSATLRQTDDRTKLLVTQPGISSTGTISRGSKSTNRANDTLAFNAQLSGDMDLLSLRHRFGIGVDLSRSKATRYGGFSSDPTPGDVSYVDPDLGYWTGTIEGGAASERSETLSQTLYAFDTIDLSPKLALSLALSFDHYDVETTDLGDDTAQQVVSDLVNGSVGLTYHFSDAAMVYGSIQTSSKPGGLGASTGGESASDDLNELDPERSVSYELGSKWQLFEGRALLSAALFRTEKNNARVENEDGDEENVGETLAQGVELGFAGQITENWGISAGYVYQDVTLENGGYSTPRGGGTPYPNPGNGKQLVKIPRNSFSVWTTYDYGERWTFGGGATYTGERIARYDTDGSVMAVIPASWQVDLMTSFEVAEGTDLRLNVNNVFDEHVYGDAHSTQHVYTEPGRNFAVTLKKTF